MDITPAKQIESAALECGFDGCGIISIDKMDAFSSLLEKRTENIPSASTMYTSMHDFDRIHKRFPWAESVVICTFDYSRYSFPKS